MPYFQGSQDNPCRCSFLFILLSGNPLSNLMCQSCWSWGCSSPLPQWCFQTLTTPCPWTSLSPFPSRFLLPWLQPLLLRAALSHHSPPHQASRASLMSSFLSTPCPFTPLPLCFSQSNLECRLDYFNPVLASCPITSSYPPTLSQHSYFPSHHLKQVLIEWKTTRPVACSTWDCAWPWGSLWQLWNLPYVKFWANEWCDFMHG